MLLLVQNETEEKDGNTHLSCLLNPVHHIMIVQEKAHWLPIDAEKEPKYHVANHCISEFTFEVCCQYDKGDL